MNLAQAKKSVEKKYKSKLKELALLNQLAKATKRKSSFHQGPKLRIGPLEIDVRQVNGVWIQHREVSRNSWWVTATPTFIKKFDAFLNEKIGRKKIVLLIGLEVERDDWKNGSMEELDEDSAVDLLVKHNKMKKKKAKAVVKRILADPENKNADVRPIPGRCGGLLRAWNETIIV